jgi:hypothetical protein
LEQLRKGVGPGPTEKNETLRVNMSEVNEQLFGKTTKRLRSISSKEAARVSRPGFVSTTAARASRSFQKDLEASSLCSLSRFMPIGARNPLAQSSSSAGWYPVPVGLSLGRRFLIRVRLQGEPDRFRGDQGGSVQGSAPHR